MQMFGDGLVGPCYFYVCFFVNNQFRILLEQTAAGSDNLEAVFEDNLKRIGKMVAILDTWDRPVYLSRIWTVFEQFVASTIQIEARNSQRQIATISLCWPHRFLMFSSHAQVIRFPVQAPNGFVSKCCTPKVTDGSSSFIIIFLSTLPFSGIPHFWTGPNSRSPDRRSSSSCRRPQRSSCSVRSHRVLKALTE